MAPKQMHCAFTATADYYMYYSLCIYKIIILAADRAAVNETPFAH